MADAKGLITEDVAGAIVIGQAIYDNAGVKVGTVDDLDPITGWIRAVDVNPMSDEVLYIPFQLVTNVDPRELFVSRSKDELHQDYSNPPPRTAEVKRTSGGTVATTRQPSGFDGTPMIVTEVNLDDVRKLIAVDDRVLTSDNIDLGHIRLYGSITGSMLVRKSPLSKNDLLVPLTAVRRVDREASVVQLALSRADVQALQHMEPIDMT